MAETLHLSSGEIEVIFNENNKEKILGNIIRENLGRDCEELFYLLFEDARNEQSCGDDYEVLPTGIEGCYWILLRNWMEFYFFFAQKD